MVNKPPTRLLSIIHEHMKQHCVGHNEHCIASQNLQRISLLRNSSVTCVIDLDPDEAIIYSCDRLAKNGSYDPIRLSINDPELLDKITHAICPTT